MNNKTSLFLTGLIEFFWPIRLPFWLLLVTGGILADLGTDVVGLRNIGGIKSWMLLLFLAISWWVLALQGISFVRRFQQAELNDIITNPKKAPKPIHRFWKGLVWALLVLYAGIFIFIALLGVWIFTSVALIGGVILVVWAAGILRRPSVQPPFADKDGVLEVSDG